MTTEDQPRRTIQVGWDGIAEPVQAGTGNTLTVVIERKPISKQAAAAQAASLRQAADSGTPLCEP